MTTADLFANVGGAATTLGTGAGTTFAAAGATAGASETWTLASTAAPLPQIGLGQQVRFTVGPASDTSPEIVWATATLTGSTMTVLRGMEGSTIKAHAVSDPFTATATAGTLSGLMPTYAQPRAGALWDPQHSVYNNNSAAGHAIRAAMAKAFTGASRCRVAGIGHSEMAGSLSGGVGVYDWPTQLRNRLAANGCPVGTGTVCLANNIGGDTRYSAISANWTDAGAISGFPFYSCTTNASSLTFTSDIPGTVVDITTFSNTASFQITIDGGSPQTVTGAGGTVVQISSFTGLVNTIHTVVVTTTSSSATYLVGVGVHSGVGFEMSNMAIGASTAALWLPTEGSSFFGNPYNVAVGAAGGTPSFAFIQLDVNEAATGVSPATYLANMQAIMTALTSASIPFAIIASTSCVPGGGAYATISQATWNAILAVEYQLADQYDVPLFDTTDRFVNWATANADGLMGDQIHPDGLGYAMMANGISPMIAPDLAANAFVTPSQLPTVGGRGTPNSSAQALTNTTGSVVTGTSIALTTGSLLVGQRYQFKLGVMKTTAAGTGAWTVAVKFGTANTVSDAAIATWTAGTNTGAIDQAILEIEVTITALGSGTTATANCMAFYVNTLSNVTGLGALQAAPGSTAGFNSTATSPFLHVDITPSATGAPVMTAWGSAVQVK